MTSFKVLIPLDGSRLAERSLAFVPAMAHLGPIHVDLISVIDEDEDMRLLSGPEVTERESNVLATYLREVGGDIEKHLGMEVATELMRGAPAAAILDAAARQSPDLLIISTHGRTGIARWRRGSVADKVIRAAECPVLVVGPKAMEKGQWLEAEAELPFRSILVPLDGSALAEEALPVALRFAHAFDSKVHLFRAVPVPVTGTGVMADAMYTGQMIDQMVDGAEQYLSQVRQGTQAPNTVVTKVRVGTPAALLEEYIAGNAIDLVVMTSHGRGGLVRTALGSVTDRLLGCDAPVLVVRPQDKEE